MSIINSHVKIEKGIRKAVPISQTELEQKIIDKCREIADYYDEEVQMATEALLAAIEPLIIIVMALIVVPIILAVMMPMFSLYNAVG